MGRPKMLKGSSSGRRTLAAPSPTANIYWGGRIDNAFYKNAPTAASPNIFWASEGASAGVLTDDAPWSATTVDGSWDRFETHAAKTVSLILWGNSGSLANSFDTTAATRCRNRGAINIVKWSTTTQQLFDIRNNDNTRLALTQADTLATAMKNWGHPLFFGPWWEMNGNWGYAWQTGAGVSTGDYITAWRNLRGRFDAVGATNVTWTFCPNYFYTATNAVDPTPWWPGSAYVDWNAADVYNQGGKTVAEVFDPIYGVLAGLAPTMPIIIEEIAATEASPPKPAWITDLLENKLLNSYPLIRGLCWFNETWSLADGHIESSVTANNAFRAGIANSRYTPKMTTPPSGLIKVPLP